jgi:hypothetical protein
MIDNDCTYHMTGEEGSFASLEKFDEPIETIIYGGNI